MDTYGYKFITLAVLAVFWAIFIIAYRKDPRRLSLAVILLPLVAFTCSSLTELLSTVVPGFAFLVALLAVLTPLMVVVFGAALVYNGVLMWRREGARVQNLLSLAAGIAVFALPVIAVALVMVETWWSIGIAFVLFMASVFTAGVFAMLLLYAWVHAKFPAKGRGAAVVVLGARTIDGKVTPLLRGRLDKGIELYGSQKDPHPLMVPTGGQGHDEIEPEGVSMARYLREQGIEQEQILVEDRAKDTIENLKFSDALVREQQTEGRLWLVTSDYHALRAGLASKQLGLDARAFGGKTAAYYRPSAFLRECVAIARDHVKLMMLLALPFGLGLAGMLFVITAYFINS
ncbi:YdcF family protein [Glutamicibacter sp.]|uniref:YdcF family protein n=1 Tax=Glutamicibacter sp. TaxID=1931995 RepID=UPI0028BD3956|nr:YdcF family protein [Glutamicibacter sp.]